jgi:hypothetical protein
VASITAGLFAALLKREELIAKIDEGGVPALATKLEFEQATVEVNASSMSPTSSATWFIPIARAFRVSAITPLRHAFRLIWCERGRTAIGAPAVEHTSRVAEMVRRAASESTDDTSPTNR